MKKLKLLDTFAGIGGFSYAAERLAGGFKTTQFIEIEPFCQKILNKHWPKVPIHDDIKTFTAKPFQYDAICGGFPCQDISTAGRRAGITKESRSGLFYELMRVIRLVRPKYVILENVAAILNNGLDIVLGELSQAGYDAEWSIISASSLGACHQRSRWWLIAYPNKNASHSFSKRTQIQYEQRRSSVWNLPSSYGEKRSDLNPNWQAYESKPCLRRGDDGLSNWTHRLKALGNAVVPQVAAIPMQRILNIEKNINK